MHMAGHEVYDDSWHRSCDYRKGRVSLSSTVPLYRHRSRNTGNWTEHFPDDDDQPHTFDEEYYTEKMNLIFFLAIPIFSSSVA